MKTRKVKIGCIKSVQREVAFYQMSLTPHLLKQFVIIDRVHRNERGDISRSSGYQRGGRDKDIKKISSFLIENDRNGCKNAIRLNDRNKTVVFKPEKNNNSWGFIELSSISELYCIDGQARVLGIIDAYEKLREDGDHSMDKFALPVVLTQVEKSEEQKDFIDINNNTRKVEAIHRALVQYEIAINRGEVDLSSQKEVLEAVAYGVIEKLDNNKNGVFNDMFILPGKPRYSKKEMEIDPSKYSKRIIKASSFLFALVDTKMIEYLNRKYEHECFDIRIIRIAQYLNKFWSVIKKKTLLMWGNKNKDYAFLGIIGIDAMMHFHYSILNVYGEEKVNEKIEMWLNEISYFQDYRKWLNTKGVKALKLKSQEEIDRTMAEKRGTSFGKVVSDNIMEEIKKINLKVEKKSVA